MKTNTATITEIVTAALAEFADDLEKQIIDCDVIPGCVRDLQGPAVFAELAGLEDKSLRTLGNDCGWNLDGRTAALDIAARRAWDAADENEEYDVVREIVGRIAAAL